MEREPKNYQELTELTAISPLDGRYREKVEDLAPFASEMALIKTRVEIEARYLVALSEVGLVRPLTDQERGFLETMGPKMTLAQAKRVKEIEATIRHDVKAMERAFREFVVGTNLEDVTEMIHFGLTSEDVNNLSYRLMLERAKREICIPALDQVVDGLADRARQSKGIPMLARTHGQPAVPTTLGKEIANFAVRLNNQVRKLENVRLTGKLNGAVGNYNAHVLAAPELDWIAFSQKFVSGLGLEPNLYTTQINSYDDMIELFQAFQRVNGVLLNIDQDMWRYISDDWFAQEVKKGEVGSSTMPQKVNPIDFENSEGNVQLANSLWEGMVRKLAVSRLQRDLSDSTTIRNVGLGLGYGLIAYRNTLAGLNRVHPNIELMRGKLNENWVILTEGVQTVLRRAGEEDPYSLVAGLSRGQRIGQDEWQQWVSGLPVAEEIKVRLMKLTPETYLGYADKLTEMALEEIAVSRQTK
ncbi:adenylosuccinate lyase [Candidatus Shapirobacteria bacterium CG09_land_8_20_14_0_10_39_12]|uniref:Adenylosuccinate lyase n=1 Tax=Candidatus Shapirobacteria bacterium CG09_land_8_20_14_0_10_39_12 TaxID=1974885 RepID=A0A2H0WQJ3_9BACT|nr:MAG: adenylosuccinate lyase [Candidatus Shapirobacteria bacterium CG09_land_8_20_14_0_10_39_12]